MRDDQERRRLVFDGDGSQFLHTGKPCRLCGVHQTPDDHLVFIRVRERLGGETVEIAHICPDCVARMFLQVTRLDLWRHVRGNVIAAIKRMLGKKRPATKRLTNGGSNG